MTRKDARRCDEAGRCSGGETDSRGNAPEGPEPPGETRSRLSRCSGSERAGGGTAVDNTHGKTRRATEAGGTPRRERQDARALFQTQESTRGGGILRELCKTFR